MESPIPDGESQSWKSVSWDKSSDLPEYLKSWCTEYSEFRSVKRALSHVESFIDTADKPSLLLWLSMTFALLSLTLRFTNKSEVLHKMLDCVGLKAIDSMAAAWILSWHVCNQHWDFLVFYLESIMADDEHDVDNTWAKLLELQKS